MSLYCVKIKYSLEAIKGMMEDGLDRAEAMRNLTEKLGGKLIAFYGMVGQEYHAMGITEVPEYANLSAGIVTALTSGTIIDYKIIPLYLSSDIEKVSKLYKQALPSYKKPGSWRKHYLSTFSCPLIAAEAHCWSWSAVAPHTPMAPIKSPLFVFIGKPPAKATTSFWMS